MDIMLHGFLSDKYDDEVWTAFIDTDRTYLQACIQKANAIFDVVTPTKYRIRLSVLFTRDEGGNAHIAEFPITFVLFYGGRVEALLPMDLNAIEENRVQVPIQLMALELALLACRHLLGK